MEGEKDQVGEKKKAIVVGPWGGNGGSNWDDGSYNGVREITLKHGRCIDSMCVVYDKNGQPVSGEKHGRSGGGRTAEAIERRSHLREGEGVQTGSPILQDQPVHYPFLSTPGAPLKHNISMISLNPTIGASCSASIGKVPKLLLDIANKKDEDSGCLTPQKMLLNSIDKVEKVVMEELRKLKRTPSARKAEREKRVRTLMSMR